MSPSGKSGGAFHEDANPLVSILIPSYNAENWIAESIDSALAQTHEAKEVIVVDDGSTDRTPDIIRGFGEKVRFIPSPHLGGNAARNLLLEAARGEWLQYLDSDDYLRPEKIALQIDALERNGSAFDIICSSYVLRNETTGEESMMKLSEPFDVIAEYLAWGRLWTGGFLMRRSALAEAGGWKKDQVACQEHELLLRLIRAGKRFGLCNVAAAVYRHHSSATVSKKDPLRTIRLRMELTDECEQFLKQEQRLSRFYSKILYTARMECARSSWAHDHVYAIELARKAAASRTYWVSDSPALPFDFQFICLLLGFRRAQQIASIFRTGEVKC